MNSRIFLSIIASIFLSGSGINTQTPYFADKSGKKVGGYNYNLLYGYVNGAWNNEMGYGLVNAYEAALAAKQMDQCSSPISIVIKIPYTNTIVITNPQTERKYQLTTQSSDVSFDPTVFESDNFWTISGENYTESFFGPDVTIPLSQPRLRRSFHRNNG